MLLNHIEAQTFLMNITNFTVVYLHAIEPHRGIDFPNPYHQFHQGFMMKFNRKNDII